MPKKETILIVSPFFEPNIGGVETHLKYYTDFLAEKKIPAIVVTYRPLMTRVGSWKKKEQKGSVEIFRIWWWGVGVFEKLTAYPALEFAYLVPRLFLGVLRQAVRNRESLAAYHAHGLAAACAVRLAALVVGRRKVVSTHYIYNLDKRKFFTKVFFWIFNGFDLVLAVGKESVRDLAAAGYPREKIAIFSHSIDNGRLFVPDNQKTCRDHFKIPSGKFAVLYAGRLIEMKGVATLLRAAEQENDIIFLFAGKGALEASVAEAADRLDNVFYFGLKSGKELVRLYNAADAVALPSTEEGASLAVIEALSCGKPVIVTDKGCSKDMFPDELGEKIDPTLENILRAIHKLAGRDLVGLGRQARAVAVEKYGKTNLEEILMNTYGRAQTVG